VLLTSVIARYGIDLKLPVSATRTQKGQKYVSKREVQNCALRSRTACAIRVGGSHNSNINLTKSVCLAVSMTAHLLPFPSPGPCVGCYVVVKTLVVGNFIFIYSYLVQ
jgi:hypothetical protein